jgi:hypothetical protein
MTFKTRKTIRSRGGGRDTFRQSGPVFLTLALILATGLAQAHYMFPEIERVPTERLIANLEKRLAAKPGESALFAPGEEIKIWSNQKRPLDGTYFVGTNGFVELPELGRVKVAGRTRDEVEQDLNPNPALAERWMRTHIEQTWHQREGRLLPGELATLEYELARVYSIAWAQGPKEFEALKGGDRPFFGHGVGAQLPPDQPRFRAAGPVGVKPGAPRQDAADPRLLEAAISHYRASLNLQTNLLPAQVGLAWCLQQNGNKAEALAAYRVAFRLAWEEEQKQSFILETSWIQELAGYMMPLLDAKLDAAEIEEIQARTKSILSKGRAMTPLIVPLETVEGLAPLVDETASVRFDLDGSGLDRRWGWITPKAAWLVYDPAGRGEITSGLQLFGNVTFWVFWKNGYEALSSLDNNGDGWLTGEELKGLALWQDPNSNGRSDPGEVRSLQSLGIEALSCRWICHETGIAYSPDGVVFTDGTHRPTYDWLAPRNDSGCAMTKP